MSRRKRTPEEAKRASEAVKGLMSEMRRMQSSIQRAGKFVRDIERLPPTTLTDVEFTRARSRVVNRWNDLRESLLMPLNELKDEREGSMF